MPGRSTITFAVAAGGALLVGLITLWVSHDRNRPTEVAERGASTSDQVDHDAAAGAHTATPDRTPSEQVRLYCAGEPERADASPGPVAAISTAEEWRGAWMAIFHGTECASACDSDRRRLLIRCLLAPEQPTSVHEGFWLAVASTRQLGSEAPLDCRAVLTVGPQVVDTSPPAWPGLWQAMELLSSRSSEDLAPSHRSAVRALLTDPDAPAWHHALACWLSIAWGDCDALALAAAPGEPEAAGSPPCWAGFLALLRQRCDERIGAPEPGIYRLVEGRDQVEPQELERFCLAVPAGRFWSELDLLCWSQCPDLALHLPDGRPDFDAVVTALRMRGELRTLVLLGLLQYDPEWHPLSIYVLTHLASSLPNSQRGGYADVFESMLRSNESYFLGDPGRMGPQALHTIAASYALAVSGADSFADSLELYHSACTTAESISATTAGGEQVSMVRSAGLGGLHGYVQRSLRGLAAPLALEEYADLSTAIDRAVRDDEIGSSLSLAALIIAELIWAREPPEVLRAVGACRHQEALRSALLNWDHARRLDWSLLYDACRE